LKNFLKIIKKGGLCPPGAGKASATPHNFPLFVKKRKIN